MTTAVTYLRVSSADQVINTSLDDQDKRTKKHISDKGWKLLGVFREEGKSAKNDDRPVLQQMLQFCAENEVDYVVSLDMSRISRNTEAFIRIRRTLSSVGTRLSFVSSFVVDDTPVGKFMSTIAAANAEYENDLRGMRAKNGMNATKKAGGWITYAPKGYKCVRVGRLPSLEPSSDAYAVRRAFEYVADGIKTPKDAAKEIGISKPSDFFCRSVFAGYNEIDGELVRGSWPAIVPLATWERVQNRMKHKRQFKQTDFWLRGHLCCECGKLLTASYSKGRTKRYGYYHCKNCHARHSARELEDRFRKWLDELGKEHATVFADAKKATVADLKAMFADAEDFRKRALAESAKIGERMSALVDLKLDGGITQEEYDAKRAELVKKRLEVQHDMVVGDMTAENYYSMLDDAAYILSNFTEFLGKSGFSDLMTVVRALVGSTTTVSVSGELSNRENDGLYWLSTHLTPPENELACLDECWVNPWRVARMLCTRVRIARAVMENVLEESRK